MFGISDGRATSPCIAAYPITYGYEARRFLKIEVGEDPSKGVPRRARDMPTPRGQWMPFRPPTILRRRAEGRDVGLFEEGICGQRVPAQ